MFIRRTRPSRPGVHSHAPQDSLFTVIALAFRGPWAQLPTDLSAREVARPRSRCAVARVHVHVGVSRTDRVEQLGECAILERPDKVLRAERSLRKEAVAEPDASRTRHRGRTWEEPH